jgi:hypothetical protein
MESKMLPNGVNIIINDIKMSPNGVIVIKLHLDGSIFFMLDVCPRLPCDLSMKRVKRMRIFYMDGKQKG